MLSRIDSIKNIEARAFSSESQPAQVLPLMPLRKKRLGRIMDVYKKSCKV